MLVTNVMSETVCRTHSNMCVSLCFSLPEQLILPAKLCLPPSSCVFVSHHHHQRVSWLPLQLEQSAGGRCICRHPNPSCSCYCCCCCWSLAPTQLLICHTVTRTHAGWCASWTFTIVWSIFCHHKHISPSCQVSIECPSFLSAKLGGRLGANFSKLAELPRRRQEPLATLILSPAILTVRQKKIRTHATIFMKEAFSSNW